MKAINKSLEPVLKSAMTASLKNYERSNDGSFLGAIYLFYDADNQALVFFDDEEGELVSIPTNHASVVWGEDMLQEIKDTTKHVLKGMKDEHAFDKDFICKPFTVSWVNKGFMKEEELAIVDDNAFKSGSDLWSGINRELNEFLKNLMK
jgi:hypothetical protein